MILKKWVVVLLHQMNEISVFRFFEIFISPPSTLLPLSVMSFEALGESFQPMSFHLRKVSGAKPANPHLALRSLATAAHQLARPGGESVSWTPDKVVDTEVPRLGGNHWRLTRTGTLWGKRYYALTSRN